MKGSSKALKRRKSGFEEPIGEQDAAACAEPVSVLDSRLRGLYGYLICGDNKNGRRLNGI